MGSAARDLFGVTCSVDELLRPSLSRLEARVTSVRLILSRLGETDALGLWASQVWTRGHMLYGPIFRSTWPRQRMLLALAAARIAESDRLEATNGASSLFTFDPHFDARIIHKLRLLNISTCTEIGDLIDSMPVHASHDLSSLTILERFKDAEYPSLVDRWFAAIASFAAANASDAL